MKILWLSHLIPYPPKGGVLQRAYYLIRETAKHHEVDLLAFNQKDLLKIHFESIEDGMMEANTELKKICQRVEFIEIPSDKHKFGKYWLAFKSLFTKDPYTINWLKSKEFRKSLMKLIHENDYDLVHLDTISLAPYLSEISGLPTVLDHHNIESTMLIRRADKEPNFLKSWYHRQEGKRLKIVEMEVCPKVSLNITCSQMDTERLKQIAPKSRIEDVPNGVDEQYFNPTVELRHDKKLLFLGTLSWYPNIEAVNFIANELWPILKKLDSEISFDIVGANPPDSIVSLSIEDSNFRVHGFVDDIRGIFNESSIFVCPITDGGGTKLKILDALSMGKVIIAHPIACEGIVVENGKSVIFAETAQEYADRIVEVLLDDDYRNELSANARAIVECNYTNKSIGLKLSSLYESCLG